MKNKSKASEANKPHVARGSVLADLGFTRSEVLELTVRAELHSRLLDYIEELKLTPSQLVSLLGIHQPDVSNLLNGRISKFSVTKLIKFAGKLNLGVEVRLTKPSTGKVFISKRTRKLEAKQLHAVVSLMSASQTARMSSLIET